MREVKFRGKSLNTGMWVYGDLQHKGKRAFIEYEVAPATIGQFTGLRDKNSKEVYEGDIVEWENLMKRTMRSVVRYIYNGFKFTDLDGEWQEVWSYTFEVIGNIYDNPEILKGGEQ